MRRMTAREMLDRLDRPWLEARAEEMAERLLRDGHDYPAIAALGALLAGAASATVRPEQRDPWLMLLAEIADRAEQEHRRRIDELDADLAVASAPPEYLRRVEAAIVRAYREGDE